MKVSGLVALCLVLVLSVGMFAVAGEGVSATYARETALEDTTQLPAGHVMERLEPMAVTREQAIAAAGEQGLGLMLPNVEMLPEGYAASGAGTRLNRARRCVGGCEDEAHRLMDDQRRPLEALAMPDRAPDEVEEVDGVLYERWQVGLDAVMAYYDGLIESFTGPEGSVVSLAIRWETTQGLRDRFYTDQGALSRPEPLANGLVIVYDYRNGDSFEVKAIPAEIRDAMMADWAYEAVVPTYVWTSLEGGADRDTVNALVASLEDVL